MIHEEIASPAAENDPLDFAPEGVPVRETDLMKFRTENALQIWVRGVVAYWQTNNPNSNDFPKFIEEMHDFVRPTKLALQAAAEDRKGSISWRHQQLKVEPQEDRYPDHPGNYDIGGLTAQNLYYRHFASFVRAEQMTMYEFDAYATLGDDECDRQGIEHLYDMFGTEWATQFFRRKNYLLAQQQLRDLEAERAEIDARIAETKAAMNLLS